MKQQNYYAIILEGSILGFSKDRDMVEAAIKDILEPLYGPGTNKFFIKEIINFEDLEDFSKLLTNNIVTNRLTNKEIRFIKENINN